MVQSIGNVLDFLVWRSYDFIHFGNNLDKRDLLKKSANINQQLHEKVKFLPI